VHHGLLGGEATPLDSYLDVRMLPRARASFGMSVLTGLVIAGVIGVLLDITEIPAGGAIGAFVGGLVSALLLYAGRRRTTIIGFLVGLFSFPVELTILMGVVTSNLYTPPQVPEISSSVLLVALVTTLLMQIMGGTVGGLLGGIIRHPPPGTEEVPSLNPPPPPQRPEKYCVQCGAGLAKGASICHACGAKQPS
jgi:hypothetical protein